MERVSKPQTTPPGKTESRPREIPGWRLEDLIVDLDDQQLPSEDDPIVHTVTSAPSAVGATDSHVIDDLIAEERESFTDPPVEASAAPFWTGLRDRGSELWLDTGDIAAARRIWTADFTGLTTNNTMLRAESSSGHLDGFIRTLAPRLRDVPEPARHLEAAFALNAWHGLHLAHLFGCTVSVELHTDLAGDVEGSVRYGMRFHALLPTRLVVKLPFTPASLIAARTLRSQGVRTNVALGFSARQNLVAAAIARPNFVNVFLGRLGAYLADNDLGDGAAIGEKALLASQRGITTLGTGTRQIAASLSSPLQLQAVAGCDIITIPVAVAERALRDLDGAWHEGADPTRLSLTPSPGLTRARPDDVWTLDPGVIGLAQDLISTPALDAEELVQRCQIFGCSDLFPAFSSEEHARLADDGKIPLHHRWMGRLARHEVAIDSLLTAAGLAAFAADQAALDAHVDELFRGC